jgi:hypothetical protein
MFPQKIKGEELYEGVKIGNFVVAFTGRVLAIIFFAQAAVAKLIQPAAHLCWRQFKMAARSGNV